MTPAWVPQKQWKTWSNFTRQLDIEARTALPCSGSQRHHRSGAPCWSLTHQVPPLTIGLNLDFE
eukprot:3708011-Pleurochrysis_carterae.AAC.4